MSTPHMGEIIEAKRATELTNKMEFNAEVLSVFTPRTLQHNSIATKTKPQNALNSFSSCIHLARSYTKF
jgi:hypothetical protein